MHLAITAPYPESQNPTLATVIAPGIYIFTIFASALIILHIHHCSTVHPPFPCHTSQPLPFTNLPTHPHPTLSPSESVSSQHLGFTPSIPLSLPPPPSSSSQSKDFLVTKWMSPANSLSNSSITSHLHRSNTLELAQTIYLTSLASHFTPSSHSTATWRSSLPTSSIQPSTKSTSPSLKQNNSTTMDRLDSVNEPLTPPPPFPWPFKFPHILLLLHMPSVVDEEDVIRTKIAKGQWLPPPPQESWCTIPSHPPLHPMLQSLGSWSPWHEMPTLHLPLLSTNSFQTHCSSLSGNTMWSLWQMGTFWRYLQPSDLCPMQ